MLRPDEAVAAFGDSKQKPEARMEAAILATWDSGKEADFQPLLQLVKQFKKKNLVKVQTKVRPPHGCCCCWAGTATCCSFLFADSSVPLVPPLLPLCHGVWRVRLTAGAASWWPVAWWTSRRRWPRCYVWARLSTPRTTTVSRAHTHTPNNRDTPAPILFGG